MASNERLTELGKATLASGPEAPCAARAALSRWLAPHVAARVLEDARLLVSELVSNSVQHAAVAADAPIHVSAEKTGGTVRVDVADLGRDARVTPRSPRSDGRGGYGLCLVDALAARWGVTHEPGTHVWFELPVRAG